MNKNFFGAIFFGALALFIVFPLLSPGNILTLDQITAIPDWTQKFCLFFIFFTAGYAMLRFGDNFFAGVLYAVNPFVYERVMAGHWGLLIGYAIFPIIVFLTKNLLENPKLITTIALAGLSTIAVYFSPHWALILAAFYGIYTTVYLAMNRQNFTKIFINLLIFAILVFVFNLVRVSSTTGILSQFNRNDLIAFQSVPDQSFGLVFNLLSGFGFWPEAQNYFISPKDIFPFWPVISLIYLLLAVIGIAVTKNKPLKTTFIILFIIALDFAGGVGLSSFSGFIFYLYEKFSVLMGLREPQKLVAIVMFCLAFFGGSGFNFIFQKLNNFPKYIFLGIIIALPFIYTPTIFSSFWGQLKPVEYPKSWSKVKEILGKDPDLRRDDNPFVLFFPWHQYMRFGFANNLVLANPAPLFFGKQILSSLNYETKSLYSHDERPEALHIEGLLTIERNQKNLIEEDVVEKINWGESVAPIGVKYIILAKETDWQTYLFLSKSPDLNKIYEDSYLILYYNTLWQKL